MSWTSIKPMDDRVLIKLDKSPRSFAGGQLIVAHVPDLNQKRYYRHFPKRGTVLAVGPNAQDLTIDDYVMMTAFNGVEVPREFGNDLLLIREEFVLMKSDDQFAFSSAEGMESWPGDRSGLSPIEGLPDMLESTS